jgi:hypothetical protein
VRGERQQRGGGGNGPLPGSRAKDRFALTLISLALEEVDATQVRDRRRGSERHTELSPTSPGRTHRRHRHRAGHRQAGDPVRGNAMSDVVVPRDALVTESIA